MSEIEYRVIKYNRKYLYSCAKLVRNTWDFHSSFVGVKDNLPIYITYVKECLNYSIHREIIVNEKDEVCGLLFGSIEENGIIDAVKWKISTLFISLYQLALWCLGRFGNRKIATKIAAAHRKADCQGEEQSDLFDGEVNLFIVAKELRGKQYGYRLMNNYVEFCKANQLKTIFLWTELSCTYSFYERYGFQRYSSFHNITFTDGNKAKDNGFVYCFNIEQK
ncbi:GNAT family N-acetyltransferase, partial [Salimicrobium jeotgali]|uniref:GNAT family N-acetyltransferase n=1 Tax=Salimicrobium jeotgali TaxID=1230341 RepID=UPI0015E0631A